MFITFYLVLKAHYLRRAQETTWSCDSLVGPRQTSEKEQHERKKYRSRRVWLPLGVKEEVNLVKLLCDVSIA